MSYPFYMNFSGFVYASLFSAPRVYKIRARLVSLLFYHIKNVLKQYGMTRNAYLTPGKNKGENETSQRLERTYIHFTFLLIYLYLQ